VMRLGILVLNAVTQITAAAAAAAAAISCCTDRNLSLPAALCQQVQPDAPHTPEHPRDSSSIRCRQRQLVHHHSSRGYCECASAGAGTRWVTYVDDDH
jgi:hypothetical protein